MLSFIEAAVVWVTRYIVAVQIAVLVLIFWSPKPCKQVLKDNEKNETENEDEMPIAWSRTPELIAEEEEARQGLTRFQRLALNYVEFHAETQHRAAMPMLQKRAIKLGFKKRDLDQCLEYIRDEAPIIIHLTEDALTCLADDTHYRNFFEIDPPASAIQIRKASRSTRKIKEGSMFSGFYDYCEPFDRPKYGCLNVTGDIAGVSSARIFGPLYIMLHQHVRHRATFFHTNSKTSLVDNHKTLGTNSYYAHVLCRFTDDDLQAALRIHKSRYRGARCTSEVHKEVQIHGPISLSEDVQALSLPGKIDQASDALLEAVNKFQNISNCNVLWQGDLLSDG